MSDQDQKWITSVVHRLQQQFPEHDGDAVKETVHDCHRGFAGSRIRDFLPILVERKAREKLKAQPAEAAAPGVIPAQRNESVAPVPAPQPVSS